MAIFTYDGHHILTSKIVSYRVVTPTVFPPGDPRPNLTVVEIVTVGGTIIHLNPCGEDKPLEAANIVRQLDDVFNNAFF